MAVYKTKDGRAKPWIADHRDQNGKRQMPGFSTKKAAAAFYRDVENRKEAGTYTSRSDTRLFRDAAREFLMDCQRKHRIGDLKAGTLHGYIWKIEKYAIPALGGRLLTDLERDRNAYQRFFDELRENLKPSSVVGIYQTVFTMLTFAVRQGWIARNILRDDRIELPQLSKRTKIPSDEAIQALTDAVEQQVRSENLLTFLNRRVCFYLGAHCGMRPGEWFGLQWEDIARDGAVLNINHSFTQRDGLHGPKSEAGRRAIGTTDQLYAALSDLALYWTIHDKMCKPGWRSYRRKTITTRIQDAWVRRHDTQIDIPPRTGHVILSKSGEPMRANAMVWFWHGLMHKAGLIGEDGKVLFTAHALRHWHASKLLASNVPLLAVSKRLGHSRGSTTTDVYGHVLPGDDSAARAMATISEGLAPRLLPPPDLPDDNRERKLTEDQVREIKARIAKGDYLRRIAKDMKISLGSVYNIKSGRSYRWLA